MGTRLKGRVAVVTGGGGGIGRPVAVLLAQEGATVVVNDVGSAVDGTGASQSPASKVVEEIRLAGGTAVTSFDSVADFQGAAKIVDTAVQRYGRLDILCHVAGVLRDRMVFNMTEEEWDTVLQVHLHGAFNVVRHAVPHMIRQGHGRIVLFSSGSGLGSSGQANYAAAKEGIVGFARALARELAPHGVTVNAIYPSGATRMTASVPESAFQLRRQREAQASGAPQTAGTQATAPMAQLLGIEGPPEARAPENNASKVVYLCTEAGGAITGQVIASGGWAMSLYSPRHVVATIHKNGRWSLDELERLVPISLASGLRNPAPPAP